MQTTAYYGNLSREHWIIGVTMAIHYFPPTFESAEYLLHNTSSTNQTVVKEQL